MSNKTLKANVKKTKSARKSISPKGFVLVVFILVFLVSLLYIVFNKNIEKTDLVMTQVEPKTTCLRASQDSSACQFYLENATTASEKARGLSGRTSVADNAGMIFLFNQEANECFWMKDMLIPLDMIWVNAGKTVVKIERNISPASYPNQFCGDARYIIELNSGVAEKNNINLGQKLVF